MIGAVAICTLLLAQAPAPKKDDQRILLRTVAGDVVLALYPEVAPGHVEAIKKLAALGAYDGTHFCRIEPNFVAQISVVEDRLGPLASEAKAAIHPLKAEFSGTLKHRRGTLSMAREDGDIDSAATSFSVLLGAAPHLDGKYTIFGEVESGMEVIDEFVKVPRNGNVPAVRLSIHKAEVVDTAALAQMQLERARAIKIPAGVAAQAAAGKADTASPAASTEVAIGLFLMVLLGVAAFFAWGRLPERMVISLGLINVLIGTFLLWVMLAPMARQFQPLGVVLFAGTIGVLKLMGKFESPPK